jgi:hypothetical protein
MKNQIAREDKFVVMVGLWTVILGMMNTENSMSK